LPSNTIHLLSLQASRGKYPILDTAADTVIDLENLQRLCGGWLDAMRPFLILF